MVKNLPAIQDTWVDVGLVPGLERSPGGRDGNPLQYSFFFFNWSLLFLFKN